MRTNIKKLLKSLAIKITGNKEFVLSIDMYDDYDELANVALKLFDTALINRKMGNVSSDFERLSNMFQEAISENKDKKRDVFDIYRRIFFNLKSGILDGNLREELANKAYAQKLKIMIDEKEFSDKLYELYNAGLEILYESDRLVPELSKYFFVSSADAIVIDINLNVVAALISFVRRNGHLVIKQYYKTSLGTIDYVETELPVEAEELFYETIENGLKIESYEKMYLDALIEGGTSSFIEAVSIRKKIDLKKMKQKKEGSGLNGLQKAGRIIISKC